MVIAQQVSPGQQVFPGQITVVPAAAAATNGLDITTLLTSIMPLIMLVMVFQMLKPMFKGMTSGD